MSTLLLVGFFTFGPVVDSRADCNVPQDYKVRIESFIKAKKPQIHEFTFDYDQPTRALVGDAKKERCVVRCHWTPGRALMTITSLFLFDADTVSEAEPNEKIVWLDGEPTPERMKPNQFSQTTPRRS